MTPAELKQAAIDCLGRAFTAEGTTKVPQPDVIQAAVAIALASDTK